MQRYPVATCGCQCVQGIIVIITSDVLESAICGIFSANAPRGRGPLDSHSLYRLWQSTGLRREDLASGIKALIESGTLRAEHRSRNCHYFLVRKQNHGMTPIGSARKVPHAESGTMLSHVAERNRNQNRSVEFGRRGQDQKTLAKSNERRQTQKNRLLKSLPGPEREELQQHLELVPMPSGMVLWERGDRVRFFYFPIDCIVSISQEMQEGNLSEVATIGNEGMADMLVLIGDDIASRRALVEIPGFAYRLPVNVLRQAFDAGGVVQRELLLYVRAFVMQIAQLTACNRHHRVEQQVCRLFLTSIDRTRSKRLTITHERIASVLGVRREGITGTIGRLREAGLISCERSTVVVLDRDGLEERACECYSVMRDEYDRLRLGSTQGSKRNETPSRTATGDDNRPVEWHAEAPINGSRPASMCRN